MKKQRAFTIIELLVAIAIIAVLVGLLFPAIGAVKRTARQQENNSKVRGVIQGMIAHSESHRGFFPGFDGFAFINDTLDTTGNSGYGQTAEARYWILLDGSYLDGESLVSASEIKDPWIRDDITADNYSFAMLRLANQGNSTTPNASDAYRREEWRNEQNSLAPLVSDRLVRDGAQTPTIGNDSTYVSIHDSSEVGDWRGSIGFGDLSVEFSDTAKVPTRIAGQNNADYETTTNRNEDDDIFDPGDSWAPAGVNPNTQAAMTYQGHNTPDGPIQ